jgi:hypothetical protein
MIEWWWLCLAVSLSLAVGYWRGAVGMGGYWAAHGESGRSICQKGTYYIVGLDDKHRLVSKESKQK